MQRAFPRLLLAKLDGEAPMDNNNARRAIGRRLRDAREAVNLTQQDVAEDVARSRQAISSWESGKTQPNLIELRMLAMLYGVTTDRLLIGMDDPEGECKVAMGKMRSDRRQATLPS